MPYSKRVIPLVGGLELVSPALTVAPGTLQSCLNYETYPIAGYSVMEGIERYDGRYPCYCKDWIVATRSSGSGTFHLGDNLRTTKGNFGVCVGWDGTNEVLSYLITYPPNAPSVGDTITGDGIGAATLVAGTGGIKRASAYYADQASFLAAQRAIYESARPDKDAIFSSISYEKNVIPHGLHWYKGQLYAIVDNYQITFDTGAEEVLPGDTVQSFSGFDQAVVLSVSVTSGSWTDGNAAGTIVVRPVGDYGNALAPGAKDIIRPDGVSSTTTLSNAFIVTDLQTPNSPSAGLYRAPYDDDVISPNAILNERGVWSSVDMGWEIQFTTDDDCTAAAPQTTFRGAFLSEVLTDTLSLEATATSETLDSTGTLTHPIGPNSTTFPASTPLHVILSDNSTSTRLNLQKSSTTQEVTSTKSLISGFDLSTIPASAIVTGVELSVFGYGGGTTKQSSATFELSSPLAPNAGSVQKVAKFVSSTTNVTLGGDSDLWGLSGLTTADLLAAVKDASFGIKFSLATGVSGSSTQTAILYDVKLKVYYKEIVSSYYAHDPSSGQDLKVDLPYYRLLKGQFNPGSDETLFGSGSFAVYNITPLDSTGGAGSTDSSTYTIRTGWELRTDRDGGGELVAKFTSDMTAASLPNRASLEAKGKRFEIINANYYANADWQAMYGVSGVGPSFQYDGYYFYNVYTQLAVTEDTPSHIAYHRNYNVLGYENGQAIVSVAGQPTNFDSVSGSTVYAFGNRITALKSLNGTALCVGCESSIFALTGDVLVADSTNNAVIQAVSPYSGIIEYTAVDCGTLLFADFRGISTIDATNKYGDFENGRVSYQVTPLITNWVNDRFSFQATQRNIMFALPVRGKNQIRFYAADGSILTCSLPSGDRGFEFTTQAYYNSANLDYMVPVAMCSATSRSGRDLLFGTFKLVPADTTNITQPSETERECYVYAIDKGTRFDLAPIKHFVRMNFIPSGDVNTEENLRQIRFEMLASHFFDGYVSISADYKPPSTLQQPIKIDPAGQPVRIDKGFEYVNVSTEAVGTTLSVEIGGESIYPGHVLQAMLCYSLPGKDNFGLSSSQKLQ